MKIGFFWTPSLASRVLEDLLRADGIEIAFVVTNPDKPVGREQVLTPSPVKSLALKNNIDTYTPGRIRENIEFLQKIATYQCDYFVVVAYGKILPKALLELPKKMCINIHGSILPKYRGASPIQAALLAWEKWTGVTIMQMSEGMDEGDILKIREIPIDTRETSGTLFDKFSVISGRALIDTLHELEMGGITPLPQNNSEATYCKKIEKEDGLIDWSKSADTIYHMWQGYTPWPGIYTMHEGKRLLLEKVSLLRHREEQSDVAIQDSAVQSMDCFVPRNDGIVGQVIQCDDGSIGIICGEWILTLDQVKLEWKKSQSIRDFVNGNNIIDTQL